MSLLLVRKLLFCFIVIGAFWSLCGSLLKKNVKDSSSTIAYLQNIKSVQSLAKAEYNIPNRTIGARSLHGEQTHELVSPPKEIESSAKLSSIDQQGDQAQDNKQIILFEEIAQEINSARSSWWHLREQIYDEMQIDVQIRDNLLHARELNYIILEEISGHLQVASEEEKSDLVDSFQENVESFSHTVQQAIGPERFNYLKKAQAKLNESLKAQSLHGTQISEDW